MKINLAQLSGMAMAFGLALALTALNGITPAEARDNGYGNYLSSGIASNSNNGGCAGGRFHGRRGNQYSNQNMQAGIYPNYNAPFGGTAGGIGNGYNNYVPVNYNTYNNGYANSAGFLNERANLQNQLSMGSLSFKDRLKLQNRLAKLEAKAFNQNQNFNQFNGAAGGGLLSNFSNQYLNNNNGFLSNGLLNNSQGVNGLASNGFVNGLRDRLGF